ncbi:MAG: HD domain-containing protein [Candidatus Marsarchaeota archaeon]|nr:HD domain-containing protein [Candidatus Marsarchaeota archaeon]
MDPIHGYIPFTELEKNVIDTSVVQRLHRLKQLGTAYLTYPSGVHSRFSHVSGAMHLAGAAAQVLIEQGQLDADDAQVLRVCALLHDVGHGPFSHSSEETMKAITGLTHEDMGQRLILETEIGDTLSQAGYAKEVVSKLAVGKTEYKGKRFPAQVVAGQVDVDKMDFLNRDSHFTGVPYGRVDHRRLIEGMSVHEDDLVVNQNSVSALEQFIIARYEMFKAVYYHRTVRASELMFSHVFSVFAEDIGIHPSMSPDEYLELDDGYVWSKLAQLSRMDHADHEKKEAAQLFRALSERRLLKSCYEATRHEADPQGRLLTNSKVLNALVSSIAEEARVPESGVFIDSPTLPAIPLSPTGEADGDIVIYDDKTRTTQKLTKVSPITSALSRFMAVVRVYSLPEHRDRVSDAASRVFKREVISEKVSY